MGARSSRAQSPSTSSHHQIASETSLQQQAAADEERRLHEQIDLDRRAAAYDPIYARNNRRQVQQQIYIQAQEQEQQQQQEQKHAATTTVAAPAVVVEKYHHDLFYTVKHRVESVWSTISSDYEEWCQLSSSPDPDPSKISKLTKTITEMIRVISNNLYDLEQIIVIVENDRQKFINIDDDELNKRKLFIHQIKEQLKQIKEFQSTFDNNNDDDILQNEDHMNLPFD